MNSIKKRMGTIAAIAILGAGAALGAKYSIEQINAPIKIEYYSDKTGNNYCHIGGIPSSDYLLVEVDVEKKDTIYGLLDKYGVLDTRSGLMNRNVLVAITESYNKVNADELQPGQRLYIPVPMDKQAVPREKLNIHLEDLLP